MRVNISNKFKVKDFRYVKKGKFISCKNVNCFYYDKCKNCIFDNYREFNINELKQITDVKEY